MTSAPFTVDVDVGRGLFETAVIGFWTLDDVGNFARAITAAGRRILDETGCAPVSVCDYSAAGTQSREVADAMETMMRHPAVRSRRIGIVTGSALARMQARRLLAERPEVRFFAGREEAVAWVLAVD